MSAKPGAHGAETRADTSFPEPLQAPHFVLYLTGHTAGHTTTLHANNS